MKHRITALILLFVLAFTGLSSDASGPLISAAHRRNAVVDPISALVAGQWKASNITGLSNGAPVATWPNTGTAGHTYDATQSTSGQRPTWQSSNANFNGRPTVLFDATNDGMATGLSLTNPYTIIIVARAVDTSTASSNRTVNSEDNNCLISVYRSADAVYNGGDILFSTTVNSTTAHVITLAIGAESHIYIDGTDLTAGHTAQTGNWGRVSFGYTGANAEPANAEIAEMDVYLSVNDTTRTTIEGLLKTEYGTP